MEKDQEIKEALSYALASDLHEAWCEQELHSFFLRAQECSKEMPNFGDAVRQACYKGKDKRNEVVIDVGWLVGHQTFAGRCLKDFDVFKAVFKGGGLDIKRFTERDLTPEEIARARENYVDGKENILRPFNELSSASQKDNLEAARVAIGLVYDKTVNGEEITPEEKEQMGAIIHEEWLKRNPRVYDPKYGKPELAVPYDKLSEEEKAKDKAQLVPAIEKVKAYANGLIDIEGLSTGKSK